MDLYTSSGIKFIVSPEDYDSIKSMRWWACKKKYAYYISTTIRKKNKSLHRILTGAKIGQIVDHINGDTLDNRRENLRLVDASQNNFNQKKKKYGGPFKGIGWHKRAGKWRARIRAYNQEISLGLYSCPIEAAKAYDEAAKKIHGEYARVNFEGG